MPKSFSPGVSEADVLRMAEAYLSRRAASVAQLRRVLQRKLDRRLALLGDEGPDPTTAAFVVEAVLGRIERSGLIDEPALAQARARTLLHKGLPTKAVRRRLAGQGLSLDGPAAEATFGVADEDQARRFAERRRLGPLASGRRSPSPDRDIRIMVRAGFSPDLARRVLRDLDEIGGIGTSDGTT